MLKGGESRVRDPVKLMQFFFTMYLILRAALAVRVYSASNRNEYRKQKNNVSGE
jgi:hypothetical protein